ncbi:MFS general substrate transporter [Thozetella sp. PMI_491]|nr:MFS general substrate transporter [Thozetella sp. PMI_491]
MVSWDGDSDPLLPTCMSALHKWVIIVIICLSITCVTCASSIYTTTYTQMYNQFNATKLTTSLGLSTFVMGIASGALLTSPLSEYYGRKPIYLISWTMFIVWTIPSAVASNIETLIVTRFFNGLAGSTFLSVVGGTVNDLFSQNEIQWPMAFVALAPFVGPSIGPLLGGFVNYHLNWRWTYYIIILWALILLLGIIFCTPETFHPVILRVKAIRLRDETGDHRYWAPMERAPKLDQKTALILLLRPFQFLFLEPMCICLSIYSAVLLGILYLFFAALPEVFRTNHHMNLWQSGLAFSGIVSGMIAAVLTSPGWERLRRYLRDRFPPAMLGGVLIPAGLFWVGWTTEPTIFWLVPIIGSSLFGCGVILVFNGVFTFHVEAYNEHAASALAANGFARAIIAATFPLLEIPLYEKLGFQWSTSILAFSTVILAPFPWIFFMYGRTLRAKSRYALAS